MDYFKIPEILLPLTKVIMKCSNMAVISANVPFASRVFLIGFLNIISADQSN